MDKVIVVLLTLLFLAVGVIIVLTLNKDGDNNVGNDEGGIQTEMPDGNMKIYGPHCHEWPCGYGYESPTHVKEQLGNHPEPSDLAGANWGGSIGPLPDLKDYFTDCLSPRTVDTTSLRGDGYNYT